MHNSLYTSKPNRITVLSLISVFTNSGYNGLLAVVKSNSILQIVVDIR